MPAHSLEAGSLHPTALAAPPRHPRVKVSSAFLLAKLPNPKVTSGYNVLKASASLIKYSLVVGRALPIHFTAPVDQR
jgi:hypothetical protein